VLELPQAAEVVGRAAVTVASLTAPVGDGAGPEPAEAELDALYQAEAEARGAATDAAPWRALEERARSLLERTKDVRVARVWLVAAGALRGARGLCEGMCLCEALLRRFEAELGPRDAAARSIAWDALFQAAVSLVQACPSTSKVELSALGLVLEPLERRLAALGWSRPIASAALADAVRRVSRPLPPLSSAIGPSEPVVPWLAPHMEDAGSERSPGAGTVFAWVLRFPYAIELVTRRIKPRTTYRFELLLSPVADPAALLRGRATVPARAKLAFSVEGHGLTVGTPEDGAGRRFWYVSPPLTSDASGTRPLALTLRAPSAGAVHLDVMLWAADALLGRERVTLIAA
jgi:hypothetical protein